jgi:hypothetical protein
MKFRKDLVVILVDTHYKKSDNRSITMINESLKEVFNDKDIKLSNTSLLLTQSNTDSLSSESEQKKQLPIEIVDIKNYRFDDKKVLTEETEGLLYITQDIFSKIEEWQKVGLRQFSKISFILISNWNTNKIENDSREAYEDWVEKIHADKKINFKLIGIEDGNFKIVGKDNPNIETQKVNNSEELRNEILEVINSPKMTFNAEDIKKHVLKYISFVIVGITICGVTFIKCETILDNKTINQTIIYEQNNFYDTIDSLKQKKDIHPNTNIEIIPPKTKKWKKYKEMEFKLIYTDSLENFSMGQYYIKYTDQLFIIGNSFQEYMNEISNLYPNPEKVEVVIQGETDAHKIGDNLYYSGEFGSIDNEKFINNSLKKDTILSIHKKVQISSNEELAFLRAKGFWVLFRGQNDYFSENKTTYQYITKENENDYEGKYRKIVFTIRIIN